MKSIKTYFIIVVSVITLAVFSIQSAITLSQFHNFAVEQIQKELMVQADKEAFALYAPMKETAGDAAKLSQLISSMPYNETNVINFLMKTVPANSFCAGTGVGFEPYFKPGQKFYCFEVLKDKDGKPVVSWDYNDGKTDYFSVDFYKKGLSLTTPVGYSEPYLDPFNPQLVWIECLAPIDVNGKRIGVAFADLTMDIFENRLNELKVGTDGYAYVVSKQGFYIGNYKGKDVKLGDGPKLEAKITDDSDKEMKAFGETLLQSDKTGITKLSGKDAYAVYSPVGDTGFYLVLMYPAAEVNAAVTKMLYINVGLIILAVLCLVGLMTFFINRRIVKPLGALSSISERVAKGDLATVDFTYDRNDEVGRITASFTAMTDNLRKMTTEISKAAEQVASASEELHATSSQSSDAANQIATTTESISEKSGAQVEEVGRTIDSIQEMASAINHIAETANSVSTMSVDTTKLATEGVEVVNIANEQIRAISQNVNQSALVVGKLGDSSQQISEIVDVISNIAGQTNLLALNAAIEAARAGEQGRGFAVVADEVRKLAEQSQEAAKRIASIIDEIKKETENVVSVIRAGSEDAARGTEVIAASGEKFTQIVHQVQSLNAHIQEVTAAAEELNASSEAVMGLAINAKQRTNDMAGDIHSISATTQEQSAAMLEIADSSKMMAETAEKLNTLVQQFKL